MDLDQARCRAIATWLDTAPEADWITEAWLFGSRAKGEARPDSDVDLAFTLRDEPGRTAEGEAICGRRRWNAALTALLGLRADTWWLNDPESEIVAPAVADHGVLLWSREGKTA